MRWRWVVLCGFFGAGCLSPGEPADGSQLFVGDWQCASGTRDIDCGQGVVVADLALGPPDVIRFEDGAARKLLLQTPSRALAPGLPGGPTCVLAFEAGADSATLQEESTCEGEDGSLLVHEGLAQLALTDAGALMLTTSVTTSENCTVKTQALCLRDR
jgi:hypothetical protein